MSAQRPCVITLDIDWAPDFVINSVANLLVKKNVCATWFVTHQSPAIERLRTFPNLFELGIHPNFMKESTHGSTLESVLRYCAELVPDALSMRTHGLFQSTEIFAKVLECTNIRVDVSLFLPQSQTPDPVDFWWNQKSLLRIPYVWEDDFEMERPDPCWDHKFLDATVGNSPIVMDFHPVHIYLNSKDMRNYRAIKANMTDLSAALPAAMDPYVGTGEGTGRMFSSLVRVLSVTGRSFRICDIAKKHRDFQKQETVL